MHLIRFVHVMSTYELVHENSNNTNNIYENCGGICYIRNAVAFQLSFIETFLKSALTVD